MVKNLWRTISAVSWAFFGVRKHKEYQQDVEIVRPMHVILVGIFLAIIFVVTLLVLVNIVIAV